MWYNVFMEQAILNLMQVLGERVMSIGTVCAVCNCDVSLRCYSENFSAINGVDGGFLDTDKSEIRCSKRECVLHGGV